MFDLGLPYLPKPSGNVHGVIGWFWKRDRSGPIRKKSLSKEVIYYSGGVRKCYRNSLARVIGPVEEDTFSTELDLAVLQVLWKEFCVLFISDGVRLLAKL